MKNTCLLSEDSKTYLCCFYQILDEMIQSMTTAGLTQSISHNFIVQMIPHRRAAIQMSQNILRFHPSQPVQRFAQRVIDQQTREIAQMEAALPAGSQLANPTADLRLCQRRMDLIYREMYAKMGSAPENNARAAVFLQQMIPHHQGAVRMAENALKYDVCTELVPLLRAIAVRQRQDIAQMRSLLRASRCQG
ncbi:MAG: DUF305 domain-containing protein [Oscillospiraceae bacterium]|nr:DUF305 domain-containing protein [Oscillospiraceae bacterium]